MITSLERKLLENPSDCICFLREFIKKDIGKNEDWEGLLGIWDKENMKGEC